MTIIDQEIKDAIGDFVHESMHISYMYEECIKVIHETGENLIARAKIIIPLLTEWNDLTQKTEKILSDCVSGHQREVID